MNRLSPISVSKELSPNDLGRTGSHQAGMHVPRALADLDFFPSLDETSLNPSRKILVQVDLASEVHEVRYVHYNNRLILGGTRNEYRLTRIGSLLKILGARVGDRVLLTYVGPLQYRLSLWRQVRVGQKEIPVDFPRLPGGWRIEPNGTEET